MTGPDYLDGSIQVQNNSNKDICNAIVDSDFHRQEGVGVRPVTRIVGFEVSLRRVQSEQKLSSRSNESPTSVFEDMRSSQEESHTPQERETLCSTRDSTPRQVSPAKSHLAEALKRSHSMPFNTNTSDMDVVAVDANDMTRRLPKLRIQRSRRAFS